MAYTLSLAHSVVPHHHHQSTAEAAAHEHSDHHHHHNTDDHQQAHDDAEHEEENTDDTGHFFFFNHDINADVLIQHGSIDNTVKTKQVQTSVAVKEQIVSFAVSRYLVFHPPQDDPNRSSATVNSTDLRGPPTC